MNVIVEVAFDTGVVQLFGAIATCSGWDSENAPLVSRPGSETVSAASPADEITFAVVVAV